MTEIIENSTPTENVNADTSTVEPAETADTSTVEPETTNDVAENDNENETHQEQDQNKEVLYAGKYKTVQDLEKGYKEAEKLIGQSSQYEKRIQELEQQIKKQETDKQQQNQDLAKSKGFNTYEELEIDNKVKLVEFEYLANNLAGVNYEYQEDARQALVNYYQTADVRYLNEAKKYFSPDVLENCTIAKTDLKNKLNNELQTHKKAEFAAKQKELINTLDNDEQNKEFLSDLNDDVTKQDTIKVFFNCGLIQSQEDFNAFKNLYKAVEEQGYKKGLAKQQADANLKDGQNKASFSTGQNLPNIDGEKKLTLANIEKMSQKEYEKYVDKYGIDAILQAE